MARQIISNGLTTCDAIRDGAAIRLDLIDEAGQPVSIEFPFAQAQSLVMTLPRLLSRALREHTNNDSARFVFGLGRWSIENTDGEYVILTLATEDGFEVAFGIPFSVCPAIGWALSSSPVPAAVPPSDPSDIH